MAPQLATLSLKFPASENGMDRVPARNGSRRQIGSSPRHVAILRRGIPRTAFGICSAAGTEREPA